MPRNSGTGGYTLPANISAVPTAVIESDDWNRLIQDLAATFNQPVPVNLGGTGMTTLAGLLVAIGGLAKAGDTMTGALTLNGDATSALQPMTKQQTEAALALKAALSHTHTTSDITNFAAGVAAAIAATNINGLANVTGTPAAGHVLIYNSSTGKYESKLPYIEYNKGVFATSVGIHQAHPLGRIPSRFEAYLKCISADNEWDVDDMIPINAFSGLGGSAYLPTYMNASFVGFTPRAFTTPNTIQKYTLLDGSALVMSRWNVIFRVFL